MLAPNVPDARDGVAVLTFTKGCATTTVVEVGEGIDTLVITTNQAGDRASGETLGARSHIAVTEFTLLGSDALVVITLSTLVIIIAVIITGLSGGIGWLGGFGGRTGRGRVATKGAGAPIPVIATLRRREGIRGLVRSTAALSSVPRPVVGTVGVGRWPGGVVGSASGKTDVLRVPPETRVSTPLSM